MRTPSADRCFAALSAAFLTAAAAGCGSSATTVTSPTNLTRCAVTADASSNVPAAGGVGKVSVAAARECAWTASTEGQWLTITSGRSGQGDGAVEFAAAGNPDPAVRRGAVILNDRRVEVTQAAAECVITLAGSSTTFAQSGGQGRVSVRASSGMCAWTAEADANWIVIREPAGRGTADLPFEVLPTDGPSRSGDIRIAGQRYSVTQSVGCAYTITPATFTAGAAGGSGTISVATAPGCAWTAGSNAAWLTMSPGEGSGPGAVSFTVAPVSGSARTGIAVVAGQTFTVNQSHGCTYAVDSLAHSLGAAGGSIAVSVATPAGCAWQASSAAAWIALSSASSATGPGTARFDVGPSAAGPRSGTVTVAGHAITISQQAQECTFAVAPESVALPPAGGPARVTITASAAGCPWTAASNDPWIQLTSATGGSGSGEVTFQAAETSGGARTGSLTIAGRMVTVSQGAACSYTLSATSHLFPGEGGSGSVGVTTAPGCAWSAASQATWLTVTSGASGSGPGSVGFAAAAFDGEGTRAGTLIVGGQPFTVTQSVTCAFTISPEQIAAGADGTTSRINVSTSSACSWTAASNAPWITVKGGSGRGNGGFDVVAAANMGAARVGTVTVAGRTLTVSQAAFTCSYTVKPQQIDVDDDPQEVRVEVRAADSCGWTASSRLWWVVVEAGRSGTGNGTVRLQIYRNQSDHRRKGTVTIAGQEVEVSQDGDR